nr:hypothetical protein [Tanacetum cinerariifolium]
MAFISSAKNSSGKGEFNTASIPTASTHVSPASISLNTVCAYIASQSNGSYIKYEDVNQIDEDDIKEMDIKWNMALLSMRADRFWKKTGKKITIQGTVVVSFNKSKVECFNCHKMGHFARECRAPRSQDRGRREIYKQGSKEEEQAPKALMKIDEGNSHNIIDDKGYWDSGCSRHMTGNISYLSDYEPYDGGYVSFGQGGGKITGKGIIKTDKFEFENVYFVKDLKYNLFSVSQICDNKNSVLFTDLECIVLGRNFKLKDDTNVLLMTPRQHNMYSIDLNNIVPHKDLTCLVAKASADESMLWHMRLGHLNFKTMNKLVRHNLVKVNSVFKPIHTLHMDLFGPTSVSSLNQNWYCLVVTDDFSRFTWTFFLKTKDETSGILRNFITEIENLKELKVKIIRCDNRGEFRNKEMNIFALEKRLKESSAMLEPLSKMGLLNRTLIEAARTMVLVNKSQNKTPYELFNGRTPAIGFLKPFGCHVMILNTLDHLGKFDAKGDEGTKNVASQDVKKDVSSLRYIALPNWFHEAHLESSTSNAQDACNANAPESSENSNRTATSKNPPADQMETLTVESAIPTISSPVLTACLDDSSDPSSDTRLISKRVTSQDETPSLDNISTLSNRFEDILGVTTNTSDTNGMEADLGNMEYNISASPTPTFKIHKDHPKSQIIGPVDMPVQTRHKSKEMEEQKPKKISDALKDPSWVEAMQEELLQFKILNVWILVDCREGEEGIDYEEVFAPVARIEAISLFLAYASFMVFTVYQMDVKSAFLYGTIDKEVYVMQPLGFQDLEFPARVTRWRRQYMDFIRLLEPGMLCREFEALMHENFQMSAMGELNFFLGLQVLQKKDGIFLSQDKYVGDILKKFGYSDVRSSNTPMDKENPWGKDGPDIMFVVCACARHQVTPKECHLHAVKMIFRYLKGHPKLGLWYPKESPFDLVAYSDCDYGDATQDRKSTTGGCQFLGRRLIS